MFHVEDACGCVTVMGDQSVVGWGGRGWGEGLSAYGMGDPVPAGALESGQRVLSQRQQG